MSEEENAEAKGFMSSALLLAAVAAIIVAGMFLRSSGPEEALRPAASAASPAPSLPLGRTVTPERGPPAPTETAPRTEEAPRIETTLALAADPLVVKLATRAEGDCERLSKARGRWTAQLIVACKPETVDRLLGAARGSTKMYVLPARVHDEACFRVCFGAYATSQEAALAADLPKTLRGKDKIGAVEIAKVLP